jgi:hypothetical protein
VFEINANQTTSVYLDDLSKTIVGIDVEKAMQKEKKLNLIPEDIICLLCLTLGIF